MPSSLPRPAASLLLFAACLLSPACRSSPPDPGPSDSGQPDAGSPDAGPPVRFPVTLEVDSAQGLLPDGVDSATVTLFVLAPDGAPGSGVEVQWEVLGAGATLASVAPPAGASARVRVSSTAPGPKVVTAHVVWNRTSYQPRALASFGPTRTPAPCPGHAALSAESTATQTLLGQPTGYAVGDWNGDGAVELAVPDSASGSLRIRLNDGKGGFTDGQAIALGGPLGPLARGDLNADGKGDLVVATGDQRVRVLLGNGDGTFTAQPSQAVPSGVPAGLVLGDLNGDGRLDVVVLPSSINTTADRVSVLLNTGAGALAPAVDVQVPASPAAVAVMDVDGDGKNDLIVASHASPVLQVLRNQGNGVFLPTVTVQVSSPPVAMVPVDLDGDGRPELALALPDSNQLTVLTNQGGLFDATNLPIGTRGSSLAVVDIDGSGTPDLVLSATSPSGVVVLRNQGGGHFAPPELHRLGPVTFPEDASPTGLQTGDLDRDGKPDLVPVIKGQLLPVRNLGAGQLDTPVLYSVPSADSGAVADLNGDGFPDVVAASLRDGVVTVFLSDRRGGLSPPVVYTFGQDLTALLLEDLDGDGWVDLLVASSINGFVGVARNQGDGALAAPFFLEAGGVSLVVADFNGDGRKDLAVDTGGGVGVVLNLGAGRFAPEAFYTVGSVERSYAVAAGDFDGDGFPDLVTANLQSSFHNLSLLHNLGDGRFARPVIYPVVTPYMDVSGGSASLVVGDFNADQRPDVLMLPYTGEASLFLNDGHATFRAPSLLDIPTFRGPAVGDVNADGALDLVFAPNIDGLLSVRLGAGNGTFGPLGPRFPSIGGQSFVADMDRDGVPDLVAISGGVEVIPGVCQP